MVHKALGCGAAAEAAEEGLSDNHSHHKVAVYCSVSFFVSPGADRWALRKEREWQG